MFNPFSLASFIIGHRQTVQNQTRCRRMWRLIRLFTVCLKNVLLKFEHECKIPANTPKIGNWLVLLIEVDTYIWPLWVKCNFILNVVQNELPLVLVSPFHYYKSSVLFHCEDPKISTAKTAIFVLCLAFKNHHVRIIVANIFTRTIRLSLYTKRSDSLSIYTYRIYKQ